MNNNVEGNGIRDAGSAQQLISQVQFNGMTCVPPLFKPASLLFASLQSSVGLSLCTSPLARRRERARG